MKFGIRARGRSHGVLVLEPEGLAFLLTVLPKNQERTKAVIVRSASGVPMLRESGPRLVGTVAAIGALSYFTIGS